MSSRDSILASIRGRQVASAALPEFRFDSDSPDPAQQFAESLAGVGGSCIRVRDQDTLKASIERLAVYQNARRILSRVSGIPGNVDTTQISNPRQLSDLDLSILPGGFGVAENGAVWLDRHSLGSQRAAFVIAQHLVLVLDSSQLVGNMHDAYARVNLNEHDFGIFISGPSKTADIEQSLVIGAHGARSCTVFLVG